MKTPLRIRFFLWLTALLLLFIVIQAIVFTFVEVVTWKGVAIDGALCNHLMEVVIGVSMDLVALPVLLAAAWWISNRMLAPVRTIATTAQRIGAGQLGQRIATDTMAADEMRELATTINEAFDRYHSAVDRLARFSGDASHQLRTPLAAVRTRGEVALAQPRAPDAYVEAIGSMLEDVDRLTKIVDQLLMLARLDGTDVARTFTPVDLTSFVGRVTGMFRPLCDERQIRLDVHMREGLRIRGNEDLLMELLSNLLDNAIRHTPAKGTIRIAAARASAEALTLTVEDSGPGIPPDQAERVFQRFTKDSGHSSGSGLGLAIVSDIAHIHWGHIELREATPHGAVFALYLPAIDAC